jgi:DNA-binding response OmpR family regulator
MGVTGPVILLVEDDAAISQPLARALEGQGYRVRAAANGAQALDLALEEPDPDLVLLDLGLPDIDGVEVCRRLRELLPQAVVVMLTARSAEVDVVVGLDAGADDYVTKPFGLAELLARACRTSGRRLCGSAGWWSTWVLGGAPSTGPRCTCVRASSTSWPSSCAGPGRR